MWFILTISSASLSVYFIYAACSEYLEYNVTTEVRLKETKELDFPVISFCNKIKFSSERSLDFIKEYIFNHYNITYYDFVNNSKKHRKKFNFVRGHIKYMDAKDLFSSFDIKERSYFSRNILEMLIACKFDQKDCDLRDFEWGTW